MITAFSWSIAGCCIPTAQAQDVLLNEVNSSNAEGIYDDFFEFDDWIELYNQGGIINLAGMYLSDDVDSLDKWMFPYTNAGITTILPGGHLLIWCDKDPEQGEDHADFKLSGEGESIYLVGDDGVTIVDSITYGLQQEDITFGRSCDGCEDWTFFNVPTPDAPNVQTAIPNAVLFINEYQTANESTVFDEFGEYDAWIEVFNPNGFQVNLGGYSLTLNGVEQSIQSELPFQTTVEANGFKLLWLDAEPNQGGHHVNLDMSGAVGMLDLRGADGALVDSVELLALSETSSSYGRSLDGSPSWTVFSIPTPRITNSIQWFAAGSIILNEMVTSNLLDWADDAGEFEDWIEIHNYGTAPVDLAGYFITDRMDVPQKYMFPMGIPDSTVIQPGAFAIIYADEDGEQGWNHVNFKLSSDGEHLALRTPDGFSVVDSLNLPVLETDHSWGRAIDAELPWIVFDATTPGASNGNTSVPWFETNPDEKELQIHPNPVRTGASFFAPYSALLVDQSGRVVSRWNNSGWQLAPKKPGLYILITPSGMAVKVLVL